MKIYTLQIGTNAMPEWKGNQQHNHKTSNWSLKPNYNDCLPVLQSSFGFLFITLFQYLAVPQFKEHVSIKYKENERSLHLNTQWLCYKNMVQVYKNMVQVNYFNKFWSTENFLDKNITAIQHTGDCNMHISLESSGNFQIIYYRRAKTS